jgi:purine-binding chemotaxis protein CheW
MVTTSIEANRIACLVCRVGMRLCALPLSQVIETMRPLPLEPFAGTPQFVKGLSIIRGTAIPVVDAGRLFGEPDTAAERLVTVDVGNRHLALAVDGVIGVQDFAVESLDDLPALVREAAGDIVSAIGVLDGDLLLLMGSARIVPEALIAALGEAGQVL